MDTLKKIESYKSRIAALESKLFGELSKLPARYGFSDAEEFVSAVRQASRTSPKAGKAGKRKRKPRAKITDATRQKVKSLVAAKKTSAAIAKELNISVPSVQNIKKALGLVKARG